MIHFDRDQAMDKLELLNRRINYVNHELDDPYYRTDEAERETRLEYLRQLRHERRAVLAEFPEVRYWPQTMGESCKP